MSIERLMEILTALATKGLVDVYASVIVEVPSEDGYFEEYWNVCGVTANNNGSIFIKLYKPERE
jgi:hypothetical protein